MNIVNEEIVKAMGLFGGGISRSCRVCGALSGGIALISSLFGRGTLDGKEDPKMYILGDKLVAHFEDLTREHGGTDCRDIARTNWQDRDQVKHFFKNPNGRRQICIQLVGDTAYALGKLLEEEIIDVK